MTAGRDVSPERLGMTPERLLGRAMPLRMLIGDLRAVDVASLSGVSQSTLSRLWDNRRWIERVEGATLSKLMAVSPSIGAYVRTWGESQRLQVAVQSVMELGVGIRRQALADLMCAAPGSAVIAALSAVAEMLQGNFDQASRLFASSWGFRSNGVADTIFASGPSAIFEDLDSILQAADTFVTTPPAFTDLNQIVGYGVVQHKLIKGGLVQSQQKVEGRNDTLAFLTRSSVIAQILSDDLRPSAAINPMPIRQTLSNLACTRGRRD